MCVTNKTKYKAGEMHLSQRHILNHPVKDKDTHRQKCVSLSSVRPYLRFPMFFQVTEEFLSSCFSPQCFPVSLSRTFSLTSGCFQTCRSMPLPPSRRVRMCCRETECLTTSKASTSSITSGGSDMTGPFTRAPKTRRTSSRYGGKKEIH